MGSKAGRPDGRETSAKHGLARLTVDGFNFHVLLQLNDVYFLDARPDYARHRWLILPRVATVVRRLREQLPNQITVCVPGDFLAPTCLGKLSQGRHMVDIFNSLGVDFVTFGNHEFERQPFTAATLAENIEKSKFAWLCANFLPSADELKSRSDKRKPYDAIRLRDDLVLVLFGVTLPRRYPGYGEATDPTAAARNVIGKMSGGIPASGGGKAHPVFVALTHQEAPDDVELAQECPELLLIMGGHDHDKEYVIKQSHPIIVKATSNARTIRVNVLIYRNSEANAAPLSQTEIQDLGWAIRSRILNRVFNTLTYPAVAAAPAEVRALIAPPLGPAFRTRKSAEAFIDDTQLRSGILRIGDYDVGAFSFAIDTATPAFAKGIPESRRTRARIKYWEQCYDAAKCGSREPFIVLAREFDARDASVRKESTNIGNLAADALRFDVAGRELAPIAILNSGSLRADRTFAKGEPISQRTICDLLFFDNKTVIFGLSGEKLWSILRQSLDLRTQGGSEGHGDFLQLSGINVFWRGSDITKVIRVDRNGAQHDLLPDGRKYEVATTDYVARISKPYAGFFKGQNGTEIDDYNRLFDAALRRLGSMRRAEDMRSYDFVEKPRWLELK